MISAQEACTLEELKKVDPLWVTHFCASVKQAISQNRVHVLYASITSEKLYLLQYMGYFTLISETGVCYVFWNKDEYYAEYMHRKYPEES